VDQPDAGENRGQNPLAKALVGEVAFEELDGALEAISGTLELAEAQVNLAHAHARYHFEAKIATRLCHGQGPLTGTDSADGITSNPKMGRHVGGDPPQPTLIADSLGESFSHTKVVEALQVLSTGEERIAQSHPEINALLDRFASLGKMSECSKRLLEARDGFPVG